MKKKKKIIFSVSILFAVIVISYLVYFFFGGKKYTFYMKDATMEIEAVQIYIDGDTDNDSLSGVIYDAEVINDIMEELKRVKLKPNYLNSEVENSEKGFSIVLLGKDNQRLYYLASKGKNNYVVDIGVEENGVLDNGIKKIIRDTSIPQKQGDNLYGLVKQALEDNIREITVSDIKKMSKEKIHDWNQFQQYLFTDIKAKAVSKRGMTSSEYAARFLIAERKGYFDVWYYNGIIVNSEGTNRYAEVLEAVVYNEKGEKIDFYAEEIGAFLEEME